MLLNPYDQYIYLDIPRTGSRSILNALKKDKNVVVGPCHLMFVPPGCVSCTVFTVVRNPYWRAYSHYLYRTTGKHNCRAWMGHWTYEKYIDWTVSKFPQNEHMIDRPMTVQLRGCRVDHHLKYEDFPECMYTLPFFSPETHTFPHLNKTSGPSDVYNEKLARKVYEFYRSDFDAFGYEEDSWLRLPEGHEGGLQHDPGRIQTLRIR